ncbi:hypothetical protein ABPG72_010694 [Tetrahymena utriculariae]
MKEKNQDNLLIQMLYQMMKDELTQHGYFEFRYVSEGAQGYVVLAKETLTNKRFAIKGIPIRDINGNINQAKQDMVNQEKNMLLKCRGSPYVSNLVKAIDGTKFTFLVLTECVGTIKELIDSLPGNKLNEISAIKYCKDISEGLHYIHSKQCIVNDLKFDNILIDYNGNAVISDFGFAQNLPKTSGYSIQEYMGNFYFQAPECYDPKAFKDYDEEYKKRNIQTHTNPSQRSEACSLGYIFYVMVQGFKQDLAFKKQFELPYDQNFETFKYKKQLRYIIDGLTQFAPRERLPVEEVLILLKGIISFEFDLDQKFVELISQETQQQANQLNQEIEFIQNFNNKYYPILQATLNKSINQSFIKIQKFLSKNEDSALQGFQPSQDEIEKLRGYSKNLEYQINSLKALQVQAESKIQAQDKIIKEQETKITKLNQEIQSYLQNVIKFLYQL